MIDECLKPPWERPFRELCLGLRGMPSTSEGVNPTLRAAISTFAVAESPGSEHSANSNGVQNSITVLSNPYEIDNTLHQQLYKWSKVFAVLACSRNSWWLLPVGNKLCTVSGSRIYMPYARRARILKQLLLGLIRMAPVAWARQRVMIGSTRPPALEQLVTDLTGEREPNFALLLGTPGPYRKLTVQVMRPSGEILGYIKLPLTKPAIGRISTEAAVLTQLSDVAELRPHIPRIIYSGEWQGGHILFQSAGPSDAGPRTFGPAHERFLETLRGVQSRERAGSDLVSEIRMRWKNIEPAMYPTLRRLGNQALEAAQRDLSHCTIPCGISHGDFAPWNTRVNDDGSLFVFDWEAAACDIPHMWDVFHFCGQTAALLVKKKSGSLFPLCNSPAKKCSLFLYVLSTICNSYELGSQTSNGIARWIKILRQELA